MHMGQALYRTYRSKSLDEIVGQEHITATLQAALKQNKISHAYLFTGPRGVGKTSTARIWAHAVNELPYTDDTPHLDIIEIDAASNRRIDEIRDLRDKVHIAPTSARYKVYIIDEVHMLTKEAFNALLKTLEEPPAHAIFILATTDAHKVPETIISRTQRYSFRPVPVGQVAAHLKTIAQQEGIAIDDDALQLLAEHGEGSFRDSISLLDQASGHNEAITAADIEQLVGMPSAAAIAQLLDTVRDGGSSATVLQQITQLYEAGFTATNIAKRIAERIRNQLAQGVQTANDESLALLGALLEVPTAHNPERYLEICMLSHMPKSAAAQTHTKRPSVDTAPSPVTPVSSPKTPKTTATATTPASTKPAKSVVQATVEAVQTTTAEPAEHLSEDAEALWEAVLTELKTKHNTLYAIVRMAEPNIDDTTVRLTFGFAFHQKQVNDGTSRKKITDIMEQVAGKPMQLECSVKTGAKGIGKPVKAPKIASKPDISTISNIFGGAELLES